MAETVETEETVCADLDATGQPLGREFVDADGFLPFPRRRSGALDLPQDLATLAANRRG